MVGVEQRREDKDQGDEPQRKDEAASGGLVSDGVDAGGMIAEDRPVKLGGVVGCRAVVQVKEESD